MHQRHDKAKKPDKFMAIPRYVLLIKFSPQLTDMTKPERGFMQQEPMAMERGSTRGTTKSFRRNKHYSFFPI